jgi:hypothetical protein
MSRLVRHVLGACAFLALALTSGAGLAQSSSAGDFDPADDSWRGLSRFVELARDQGIDVEIAQELNWSKQDPEEVLVFVHPRAGLKISSAAGYVIDGGRMLLADDFGVSSPFLERLDVSRVNVEMDNLPHARFVHGNPALPIFEPTGRHPLLDGVDTLVANHPAVLLNVGGPVVSYDDGGGLIYDMNLGEGKAVLFGDASLLINHMLSVADNGLLAQNTLDYLCRSRDRCRMRLFVGEFDQHGRYRSREPSSRDRDGFADQIESLNELISDFMEEMPAARLLYYLGILLAAGLALYLAAVFRIRPSQPYSRYIDKITRDVPDPQSEFDWNLSRFGGGGRETNYALPLAILKEVFEELFLSDLGYWPISEGERPSINDLGRAFARKHLTDERQGRSQQAEREVVDLLATYASIPTRHRVFLDSDAYFSERDLINIYRRTRRVLTLMGLEEEYERRTRSLV